jgi:hypothetical protein
MAYLQEFSSPKMCTIRSFPPTQVTCPAALHSATLTIVHDMYTSQIHRYVFISPSWSNMLLKTLFSNTIHCKQDVKVCDDGTLV